jgi:sirohydrochlorin ferrochelatase
VSARPDTTWLVVAHGSRNEELAAAHDEVCRAVAARVGGAAVVRPAYLELTEPSIPDAIDREVAEGARRIVLVPYFLHVGNHTRRDLPRLLAEARERHPGVDLVLADHLGIDERLVDLVVRRASAAVTPEEPSG